MYRLFLKMNSVFKKIQFTLLLVEPKLIKKKSNSEGRLFHIYYIILSPMFVNSHLFYTVLFIKIIRFTSFFSHLVHILLFNENIFYYGNPVLCSFPFGDLTKRWDVRIFLTVMTFVTS